MRTILLESERRTLSTKPSTSLGHLLEEADEEESHASLRQVQQRRSASNVAKGEEGTEEKEEVPCFSGYSEKNNCHTGQHVHTLSLPSGLSLSFTLLPSCCISIV